MNFQVTKPGLEMGVLSLLRKGDMYGYEIIAAISDVARITAGSVYPMLKAMKQEGLVETYLEDAQTGAPRKYYRTTEAGLRRCQELQDEWINFITAMFTMMRMNSYKYERSES